MHTRPWLALVGLIAGSLAVASTPATTSATCLPGPVEQAAKVLVHEQAWVIATSQVGGIDTALVAEPTIAPWVRRRLVATDLGWCTTTELNRALAGRDALSAATTFVSLAPTPYFDDVEVVEAASLGAGALGEVVRLRTVALTNGVASDWTVVVDGDGVRDATFTTTAIGLGEHVEVQIEGVTSLPGHTRTWTRDDAGRLHIDLDVEDLFELARADSAARRAASPGDIARYVESSDGFVITLHSGSLPSTLETAVTGVDLADRHLNFLRYAGENWEEMLTWGIRAEWPSHTGELHVDGQTAVVCMACAKLGDLFEVHMLSVMPEVAEAAFGLAYDDHEEFVHGVIGHELIHSAQGGHSDGAAVQLTNAFIEGLARASEAIRHTAPGTHQPNSIMYAESSSGCNGFRAQRTWEDALAKGPFLSHTYDACFFWLTWFSRHGPHEAVRAALQALPAVVGEPGNGTDPVLNLDLLDAAFGDVGGDLATWAVAAASGTGWTLPAGVGGEVLDWSEHLLRPDATETLAPGGGFNRELEAGGVAVARVSGPGRLTASRGGWVARESGGAIEVSPLSAGVPFNVPAADAGEHWWVALVNDGSQVGALSARLT